MINFFSSFKSNNLNPLSAQDRQSLSTESRRLIDALAELDISMLNETRQLRLKHLMEKLVCVSIRDQSLQTLNRIRSFKDRLETRLLSLAADHSDMYQNWFKNCAYGALFIAACALVPALPISAYFLFSYLSVTAISWLVKISVVISLASMGCKYVFYARDMQDFRLWPIVVSGLVLAMLSEIVLLIQAPFLSFEMAAVLFAFPLSLLNFTLLDTFRKNIDLSPSKESIRQNIEQSKAQFVAFLDQEVAQWQAYDAEKEQEESNQARTLNNAALG